MIIHNYTVFFPLILYFILFLGMLLLDITGNFQPRATERIGRRSIEYAGCKGLEGMGMVVVVVAALYVSIKPPFIVIMLPLFFPFKSQ